MFTNFFWRATAPSGPSSSASVPPPPPSAAAHSVEGAAQPLFPHVESKKPAHLAHEQVELYGPIAHTPAITAGPPPSASLPPAVLGHVTSLDPTSPPADAGLPAGSRIDRAPANVQNTASKIGRCLGSLWSGPCKALSWLIGKVQTAVNSFFHVLRLRRTDGS